MKKIHFSYLLLVIGFIAGPCLYYVNWKFIGGLVSGFCLAILLAYTLGKYQLKEGAKRIDKLIQDKTKTIQL